MFHWDRWRNKVCNGSPKGRLFKRSPLALRIAEGEVDLER